MQVDNATLLALYMDDPRCWCLCPASVANALLLEEKPVELHELTHRPPDRTCYYLTSRTPKSIAATKAAIVFQKKLYAYLLTLPPLIELLPSAASVLTNINHSQIV